MTESTAIDLPGYRPGTWEIDPVHSEVGFSVRHLMISKVRGTFAVKSGVITAPENPLEASITASIDVASVHTKDAGRDEHLKGEDFFNAAEYPTMDFASTGVRYAGDDFLVDGDLTVKGVSRPVTFTVDFGGFSPDPWGGYRAGATAKTVIDREEFGLTWNAALETGGVVVGKDVTIELDLQGSLQA